MALIRNGNIIWQGGFGVKNSNSGEPVNENTVFEAASLTKPLFAYAVMMLIEEGVLDLDTPLVAYLSKEEIEGFLGHPLDEPGFRRECFEKITARHALSHSAGTPHGEGGDVFPLFFEPGTENKYSAQGYYLLQLVVERLKEEGLDVTIEKYVLDPLGMKHSCMVWREDYENTAANGHGTFAHPAYWSGFVLSGKP